MHTIDNKIIYSGALSCKTIFISSNHVDVLIHLKFACACKMRTIAQTMYITHINTYTQTLKNSHIYHAHIYQRALACTHTHTSKHFLYATTHIHLLQAYVHLNTLTYIHIHISKQTHHIYMCLCTHVSTHASTHKYI